MSSPRTIGARPLHLALALSAVAVLVGCPRPVRPPAEVPPAPPAREAEVPADARRFDIVPGESQVSILVYRAGTLAKAGHNHVITSREVTGVVQLTPQLERSQFQLAIPVSTFVVDDAEARRAAGPEFAADVPQSAREGTRRNMLSEALLDAERFPQVSLASTRIEAAPGGALATVEVRVRDQASTLTVPIRYEQKAKELLADGEIAVRQSDLGLTPFSALLGALQVQDEMTLRFRILARATSPAP